MVRFFYNDIFEEILDKVGIVPLPPYITAPLEDKERYQTVYSKFRIGSSSNSRASFYGRAD